MIMQGCVISCGTVVFFKKSRNLSWSLLTNKNFYCVIIITFIFFKGFAWAGFSVNHLDVAPQYAAILMGISNTLGTIPGIISPSITGYLVEDKSVDSWQHVFIITAFVYALGAIFYGIFASGERQEWSKIDRDEELVRI